RPADDGRRTPTGGIYTHRVSGCFGAPRNPSGQKFAVWRTAAGKIDRMWNDFSQPAPILLNAVNKHALFLLPRKNHPAIGAEKRLEPVAASELTWGLATVWGCQPHPQPPGFVRRHKHDMLPVPRNGVMLH